MRNTFTKLAIAASFAAMFAPAIIPMQAQAKLKTVKMHYVEGQFSNPPTIVMRNNGNSWLWDNKNDFFQIAAKIKLHAVGNRITGAGLFIDKQKIWGTPTNGKRFWKLEKLVNISLNKNHMAHLVPSAVNLCQKHGSGKKVVKAMPSVSKLAVNYETGAPQKVIPLPVRVICLAKPSSPAPATLKVTNVKLYFVPKKPACGEPVTLYTLIKTNIPGKVDFQLYRRGGGKQNASVTTQKAGSVYAKHWSKQYTFKQNTRREYKILINGQKISTRWIPIKVQCGASTGVKKPKKSAN